jgi:cell fate (sporulation/competence/biofilm development) regulator YmcA (YheA/YmcA/DUF963 family)
MGREPLQQISQNAMNEQKPEHQEAMEQIEAQIDEVEIEN